MNSHHQCNIPLVEPHVGSRSLVCLEIVIHISKYIVPPGRHLTMAQGNKSV